VETWESVDSGTTWTRLAIAGPSGNLRGFALASDASGIYLSGGSNGSTLNSMVWRFNGAAWTQVTAAAAFPARERHAMVSHAGALYVLGGRSGTTLLEDTWRSTDGGATWTLAANAGFRPRYDFCVASHPNGSLYVLGGKVADAPVAGDPGMVTNAIFRTTNGSDWSGVTVSASSPVFVALATKSGACAVLGERIIFAGDAPTYSATDSSTVSSTDGVLWNFEPHRGLGMMGLSPGGVALAGSVFITSGSGTSQRYVLRSIP
jgi:hypothetical protein